MTDIAVGIIMGSRSDWGVMESAATLLEQLGIPYEAKVCLLYTSPSPRDLSTSRMPSSA